MPRPRHRSAAANYRESNRITTVAFAPSVTAGRLVQRGARLRTTDARQRFAQMLADALNRDAGLPPCRVTISDTRQYHSHRGGRVVFRQYGYYRPQSSYVYIQNRTAVRGQHLAPLAFLTTLLHEWVHHYDTHRLGLHSIHTAGFYHRLRHLRTLLGT